MKYALALAAAFAAAATPAFSADCSGAMEGTYSLVCRGPLTYEMYQRNGGGTGRFSTEIVYQFEPATVAGGVNGAALPPGRCAWSDRPLNRSEPHKLGFIVDSNQAASAGSTLDPMTPQMWDKVDACLGDEMCRVSFCAANANDRLFIIDIGENWLSAFGRYAQIHHLTPITPMILPIPEPARPRPGIDQ